MPAVKVFKNSDGDYECGACEYLFDDHDLTIQPSNCPDCGAELDYSDVVKKKAEEKCSGCDSDCAMTCGSDGDGTVY